MQIHVTKSKCLKYVSSLVIDEGQTGNAEFCLQSVLCYLYYVYSFLVCRPVSCAGSKISCRPATGFLHWRLIHWLSYRSKWMYMQWVAAHQLEQTSLVYTVKTTWEIGTTWELRTATSVPTAIQYLQMHQRNKITSEFRTVFLSPLGVPNSQVPLYMIELRTR